MTPDASTITCPKCKAKIPLSDAVAAPLLEAQRASIQAEEAEKAKVAAQRDATAYLLEERRLREQAEQDRQTALDRADRLNVELARSQAEQARLLAKERELDDARRELDLTVAQRVNESAGAIRAKAQLDAEAAAALRVSEKQILIDSLTGKIEELNRRAEQGDNRVQGEAQELVLEAMLRAKFPMDTITPVAKGVFGGDCLQTVLSASGQVAGTILWESKRTKTWEAKWVGKLRDDMRAAKADVAILVSQTVPKEYATFDRLAEDVWVAAWQSVYPVALAMRQRLIDIAVVRGAQEGQATKAELLYKYLTGPTFKSRMQAAVEKFNEMADDLRKERAAMTRGWAKREGQIQQAVESVAGCVGDVQGIAGKAVGEIAGLMLTMEDGHESVEGRQ